jgi:hypothetical protein
MLYRETFAVYTLNDTEHVIALYGQNADFCNVNTKEDGM